MTFADWRSQPMRIEKRVLILVWLLAAGVLGVCLSAASLDRRPLDDPDLVFQRPGFLDAHGMPFPAQTIAHGLPSPGRRLVLFFVRPEQAGALETALGANATLPRDADLAAVVTGPGVNRRADEVLWLADSAGDLARGFHMPKPRDGGPPVGYAIVDSDGMVRYRTLDPTMAKRLKEVETMLKVTP